MKEKPIRIVGLMSGTSLDGLDIALCEFWKSEDMLRYSILEAETISYPEELKAGLINCNNYSLLDFLDFHRFYGKYLGEQVDAFLNSKSLNANFIASHGHTIFHEPFIGRNFQLGEAAAIAAAAGLPVIADFRSLDICLGGQGAPLVPAGDELLFSEYGYRLNLGGFCNISMKQDNQLIAWDVGPFNMAMNYLSMELGFVFDEDGRFAAKGAVNPELKSKLDELEFYQQKPPKSLGREWFELELVPLFECSAVSTYDKLATFSEHIAGKIADACQGASGKRVLLTGGGALNTDFVTRLRRICMEEVVIPDPIIVNYKEALIFALLGYLRVNQLNNTFKSVSGASMDSCGGSLIWHSTKS